VGREFASRFLDGYAKANRLKPSGIASKETALRVHLAKAFGDKRLNEINRIAQARKIRSNRRIEVHTKYTSAVVPLVE
jgi:hypothetical protein